jgi:hypothetical protein
MNARATISNDRTVKENDHMNARATLSNGRTVKENGYRMVRMLFYFGLSHFLDRSVNISVICLSFLSLFLVLYVLILRIQWFQNRYQQLREHTNNNFCTRKIKTRFMTNFFFLNSRRPCGCLTLFGVVTGSVQWRFLLSTKTALFWVFRVPHARRVCDSCAVCVAFTFFSWNYSNQDSDPYIRQSLYQFEVLMRSEVRPCRSSSG